MNSTEKNELNYDLEKKLRKALRKGEKRSNTANRKGNAYLRKPMGEKYENNN